MNYHHYINLWWQRASGCPPPFKEQNLISMETFCSKGSPGFFHLKNKSPKTDRILLNSEHICFFSNPLFADTINQGKESSHPLEPSTTYYIPSSGAFPNFFHVLAQPDIFTWRQNHFLSPSFFLLLITSQLPSLLFFRQH